ncbi:MAG: SPOR domain-containing protein [Spirochaetia bacterium]|nr:SPOR domain-containing protein [Spirochaetota bacterium]MCX8095890.1 SPOR domain-containing protein [Spirochaetota bacterium]MDW8112583.1 SPOR domain-containing protein [Spirochaetia bacterium]
MNFEKDEFNEYGVRTNFQPNASGSSKSKISSGPKLSLIVIVTVLFSVFNFVVGYMIGKFMNSNTKEVEITSSKTQPDDVLGLPSSKQSFSEQKNKFKEEFIPEDEEITDLIPKSFESNKNTLLETKIEKSVEKKSGENVISRKKEEATKSEMKTKVQEKKQVVKNETPNKKEVETKSSPSRNVKYFIQVSSNERKDVAESNLNRLKSIGISGFIQEATVDGKKLFRVRVGGFESYEEATKVLEKARKVNQSAFLVVSK